MVKRILLLTAALASAILAGCTSAPSHRSPFEAKADRDGLDPLIDAPLRTQAVCKGTGLFSAGMKLGGFSFECPDLDVVATMNELRDAGWRVETIRIGHQEVDSEESGSQLTVTMRKVY